MNQPPNGHNRLNLVVPPAQAAYEKLMEAKRGAVAGMTVRLYDGFYGDLFKQVILEQFVNSLDLSGNPPRPEALHAELVKFLVAHGSDIGEEVAKFLSANEDGSVA